MAENMEVMSWPWLGPTSRYPAAVGLMDEARRRDREEDSGFTDAPGEQHPDHAVWKSATTLLMKLFYGATGAGVQAGGRDGPLAHYFSSEVRP